MYTYEVHFIWNGRAYQEQITTTDIAKARQLIQGRYTGAKITGISKIK